MKRVLVVSVLAACSAQPPGLGEVCTNTCRDNLACVPDVGAEYGYAATDDVCESPRAVYAFMHYGERGPARRVDNALDMLDGVYRLPRMDDDSPPIATMPYELVDASGATIRAQVPDWRAYYTGELGKYDRFILYGLRMTGALLYTAYHAEPVKLRERIVARTGRAEASVTMDEVRRVQARARDLALAVFDSFVARGHFAFALDAMPSCYAGSSGYQNPNASWAPDLVQWDPGYQLSNGRLVKAADVPVDCTHAIAMSYDQARDSIWYRHGVAFRAMALGNAYFMFRGVLPAERRTAWLTAIRETGEALALPSSYEPGDNHGISESVALLQLGVDFAGVDSIPMSLSDAWRELGRRRLNDIFVDTVFHDGVQVEQSMFYHNYELVLLLQVLDWLDAHELDLTTGIEDVRVDYDVVAPAPTDPDINDVSPSSAIEPRAILDTMVRASLHLAQPDGWMPMIGSSVPQRFLGYAADVLGSYAGRYARELAYYQSGGASGRALPDDELLAAFPEAGFVTMHSGFTPPAALQAHVVLNAGMPYHRHSHADALSVHLYGPDKGESGMALLVDSGWFSYDSEGRHYFQSTSAHNTVTVDGLNQCVRDPAEKRVSPYDPTPLSACAALGGQVTLASHLRGNGWSYASAAHSLYAGVTHRRGVALIGADIVVVVDALASADAHTYSQLWHVTPVVPRIEDTAIADDGTLHVVFPRWQGNPAALFSLHQANPDRQLAMQLHYGEPDIAGVPGQGWISFGEDRKDPNLVVESRRNGATAAFASVFLLGPRAGETPQVSLQQASPTDATIAIAFPSGKRTTIAIRNLAGEAETVTIE